MAKAKKPIALLFLGIFLLVKISPAYCIGGSLFVPAATNAILRIKAVQPGANAAFLMRMDKCVLDSESLSNIPKIKFAGTLFSLPAVSVYLANARQFRPANVVNVSIYPTRKYLALGILRI